MIAVVALVLAVTIVRASPVVVLGLVLAEAMIDPRPIIRPRDVPDSYTAMIASQADIAEFLKRQPGWFRVEIDDAVIQYNFGDFYGIEQLGGYAPGLTRRIQEIQGHPALRRWYGVQYFVGRRRGRRSRSRFSSRAAG